jgi:hypothetical protein
MAQICSATYGIVFMIINCKQSLAHPHDEAVGHMRVAEIVI